MHRIHPTAIVDPLAEIAEDVEIGPYVVIKGHVRLARGVVVESHSIIHGRCDIGQACVLGPAAYVGTPPQYRLFDRNLETLTLIGPRTVIREGASVHRSIHADPDHATRVGADCYIMCDAHVGHDCAVGDGVTMANAVLLGGHVTIGEKAFLGGGAEFHQFVRVGRLAIVAGNESVSRDIPPFAAVRYQRLKGYNAVGCRRAGLRPEVVRAIRHAYLCLHQNPTTTKGLAAIENAGELLPEIREIVDFIRDSKRGIQPSGRELSGDLE